MTTINARYLKIKTLTDNTFLCLDDLKIISNGVNISLNAPITSSFELNNSNPANLVDGSKYTELCLDALSGVFHEIVVDLLIPYKIDTVVLRKSSRGISYFTNGVIFELFTTLSSSSVFTHTFNSVTLTESIVVSTPISSITNVSINGFVVKIKSENNNNFIWLYELEIYNAGINISPGKFIKSSPIYGDNISSNIIDNKNSTFTILDHTTENIFISLNLGALTNIDSIIIRKKVDSAKNINTDLQLIIYDPVDETNIVFQKKLTSSMQVETIQNFSYTPETTVSIQNDLVSLNALVQSLVTSAPLTVSDIIIYDVISPTINTLINNYTNLYDYILLNNTHVGGNLITIDLLGTGLSTGEKGYKRSFVFNAKVGGATQTENYIRIRIDKMYFNSPEIYTGVFNYYTFDLRNTGQSVNFVWSGTLWFMPNPGNVIFGTQV
jgi:hypothetical protein